MVMAVARCDGDKQGGGTGTGTGTGSGTGFAAASTYARAFNTSAAPSGLTTTKDGGFVVMANAVAFATFGNNETTPWLLRFDADGNVVWQEAYNTPFTSNGYSIIQCNDGGFVFAGTTVSVNGAGTDALVVKLDADGKLVWQKEYGTSGEDFAKDIQQTLDGGYIFTGYSNFGGAKNHVWVVKLDATGGVTWQKSYAGSDQEFGTIIRTVRNGSGYVFAANTTSYGQHVPLNFSPDIFPWIVKINLDGSYVWQKAYGDFPGNGDVSIAPAGLIEIGTTDGFIVAGAKSATHAVGSMFFLRLSPIGQLLSDRWSGRYGIIQSFDVLQNEAYLAVGMMRTIPADSPTQRAAFINTNSSYTNAQQTYTLSGLGSLSLVKAQPPDKFIGVGATLNDGVVIMKGDSNGNVASLSEQVDMGFNGGASSFLDHDTTSSVNDTSATVTTPAGIIVSTSVAGKQLAP